MYKERVFHLGKLLLIKKTMMVFRKLSDAVYETEIAIGLPPTTLTTQKSPKSYPWRRSQLGPPVKAIETRPNTPQHLSLIHI